MAIDPRSTPIYLCFAIANTMGYKKIFSIGICLLMYGWCVSQTVSMTGRLLHCDTQQAIGYANVVVPELGRGTVSDEAGCFAFSLPEVGVYRIQVSCIGFITIDTLMVIDVQTVASFCLQPHSLSIAEVSVIAEEKKGLETASKIRVMAMQHLQPSSFTDLLTLLPGMVSVAPNLSEVNPITLRQAPGAYQAIDNTALGTAVIVDGMALSNDVNMQAINGLSGESEGRYRLNQNNGLDMRQISTDQIESVEIIRGIPSVEHGDLSSGVVIITRKTGATAWQGRLKTDLKSKLVALEKGVLLPGKGGVINAGVDYLHHYKTPANPLETYQRLSSSVRYHKKWLHARWHHTLKASGNYAFNMDATRQDPELNHGQKDLYESVYRKLILSLSQQVDFTDGWLRMLKMEAGYTQGYDVLKRERNVQLTGPTALPLAEETKKGDGIYLPSNYNASLEIEGQPRYAFLSLCAGADWQTTRWQHKFKAGMDYRYDKNQGAGIQMDKAHPIYPNQSMSRPRDLSRIPALQDVAIYLEDQMSRRFKRHRLEVRAGVRFQVMAGLAQAYQMRGEVYPDPRFNVRWNFPALAMQSASDLRLAITGGYGWHTKTPTMSMVYPEPVYDDLYELNYYSNVSADWRRLYVYTIKQDVTNYNLTAARNLKKEIGLSVSWGTHKMDVTFFQEEMTNGFSRQALFRSLTYRDYDESSVSSTDLTGPPALAAFAYHDKTILNSYTQWSNTRHLNKKGIEYQVALAPLKALQTSVTINGAYFKTQQKDGGFGYERPGIYLNNEPYPYTGVYQWPFNDNTTDEWLNTNVRLDTHLPALRLLTSVSFQSVWFKRNRYEQPDGTPLAYLTPTGERLPFTQADATDPVLNYLVYNAHSRQDQTVTEPLGLTVDLKVSKEIGAHLRVSFFVQNLFDYHKPYTNRANQVVRPTSRPYFGMEANIKL